MGSGDLVLVSREALVDLIPREDTTYEAVLGGSGFNTAIGLGRLSVPTGYASRLSTDAMSEALAKELAVSGVAPDPRPLPS